MPQVVPGEVKKIAAVMWKCGECLDEGAEFTAEEAKVILHCVNHHQAFDVDRDAGKRIVRIKSKTA